jgi:hypothetical protein
MFLFLTTNYLNLFDIIIYVKSPPAFVDELPFSAHSFASHPEKNRAIRTPKLASSAHRWRWGWALEASCKAEIYFIRMGWNEEITSATWG